MAILVSEQTRLVVQGITGREGTFHTLNNKRYGTNVVGGGADADKIVTALEVILSDTKVKAILFNIFGGITRCDEVAKGILAALERLDITVPIVVRLDGTNDVEGRRLLADAAPPNVYPERTMLDAARKVVELAGAH